MSDLANKLKELIKRTPGIFLVRLADLADCDVDVVHVELADAIRRGEILSEKADGPNGLKTQAFRLNPTFLGWGNAASPAAQNGVNIDKIHPPVAVTPAVSKVDKALAYLHEHGTASPQQLASAMDIDPKYSASQYVSGAIKSGQIGRDGNQYRLGRTNAIITGGPIPGGETNLKSPSDVQTRPTLKIPRFSQAPARPAKTVKSLKSAKSIQSEVNGHKADTVSSSLHVGGLQIMVWQQSGHMVVSAHDNMVDLTPEQVRALMMFIGLMGASHGQA